MTRARSAFRDAGGRGRATATVVADIDDALAAWHMPEGHGLVAMPMHDATRARTIIDPQPAPAARQREPIARPEWPDHFAAARIQ